MPVQNDPHRRIQSNHNVQHEPVVQQTHEVAPPEQHDHDALAHQRAIENSNVGASLDESRDVPASRANKFFSPVKARLRSMIENPKVVAGITTVAVGATAFAGVVGAASDQPASTANPAGGGKGVTRTIDAEKPVTAEKVTHKEAVKIVDQASQEILGGASKDAELKQEAKRRADNGVPANQLQSWAEVEINANLREAIGVADRLLDQQDVKDNSAVRDVRDTARDLVRDGVDGQKLRVELKEAVAKHTGDPTAKFLLEQVENGRLSFNALSTDGRVTEIENLRSFANDDAGIVGVNGAHVKPNPKLLQALAELTKAGPIQVTGGILGGAHSDGSDHYIGQAFDISPYSLGSLSKVQEIVGKYGGTVYNEAAGTSNHHYHIFFDGSL